MKKIYTKPEIAVIDIKPTQLLNGGSGNTPLTIPMETESEDVINKEEDVW